MNWSGIDLLCTTQHESPLPSRSLHNLVQSRVPHCVGTNYHLLEQQPTATTCMNVGKNDMTTKTVQSAESIRNNESTDQQRQITTIVNQNTADRDEFLNRFLSCMTQMQVALPSEMNCNIEGTDKHRPTTTIVNQTQPTTTHSLIMFCYV